MNQIRIDDVAPTAGQGQTPEVRRSAYQQAARAAFQGDTGSRAWEDKMVRRQGQIRGLYLSQAKLLGMSADPRDRVLAAKVKAFVEDMPHPDSQRLALARELRAAAEPQRSGRDRSR